MELLDKLRPLRERHLLRYHNLTFYDYQNEFSDAILKALINNLELTNFATEEMISDLESLDIAAEFSRQSGKTTTLVHTVEVAMIYLPEIFARPLGIGIFAPQIEQAKTDFDRLKDALWRSREIAGQPQETNARTLVLGNGSSCYIFPITKTSRPESKSLDLIVFEEAQDIDDEIAKVRVYPMGKTTNAPRIHVGTAGFRLCQFYRLVQEPTALVYKWDKISEQRRKVYEITSEPSHLLYEQSVKMDMVKFGEQSDEFKAPYNLEWILEAGMFVTRPQLLPLRIDRAYDPGNTEYDHYFGLDTAKEQDQTVLKIGRMIDRRLTLVDSLELRGINYQDQFQIILQKLQGYKVAAGAVDSTGQGDFMPDLFERNSGYKLYRVKFSLMEKDHLYKTFYNYIVNDRFRYFGSSAKSTEDFEYEMLNLIKEYKGTNSEYMMIHHPDVKDAHDDHPDSTALMVLAFDNYNGSVGIRDYYKDVLTATMPTPVRVSPGEFRDYV